MRKWIWVFLAALIVGCGPQADQPADTIATGPWRGEIDHFGRTLPFNMELRQGPEGLEAVYLNGKERMPVEQVAIDEAGKLELNFPSYSSGLSAQVKAGSMTGEIALTRRAKVYRLPFTATQGLSHRFFDTPAGDYADFSGRWAVEIYVPAFGFRQPAIALFEQSGAAVSGTVLTQVGDFRFLSGEARGQDLYLSAFDGGGTQLWLASLDENGSLRGNFDSVTYQAAEWTAVRDPDVRLEDPLSLTYLKPGYDRVSFSFPDLNGETVSLPSERFDGKVVLIVIGGTWCPTCHDEAQFMVPFQASRADKGLEVIDLMFEYSDRFEDVAEQMRAYRDRYAIQHPILFAGDSARETRAEKLPMLNDIVAFPTTIFIDRQGQVRRIHTAFPGPASGEEHENYKREFTAFVDLLLDERA